MVITDNLSSHNSASTRTWLLDIPASSTPSSPPAPAGSTCRKAAGGCFAARRLPASRSPPLRRSPSPRAWRPASSTPVPAHGCGADHHHQHAIDGTSSSTGSKELSTR
jgi:hypothetical protein